MFLKALTSPDDKKLFLELAAIIAIADGGKHLASLDESKLSDRFGDLFGNGDHFGKDEQIVRKFFISSIVEQEKEMLDMFTRELSSEEFPIGLFNEEDFSGGSRYAGWLAPLLTSFIPIVEKVLEENASDGKLKKEVLTNLVNRDVDISLIDKDVIKLELMAHPEVNKSVLVAAIKLVADKRIDTVTLERKKVMMFELMGIAYSDGDFSPLEFELISVMADIFGLDAESLSEVSDVVAKIYNAANEAIALINE